MSSSFYIQSNIKNDSNRDFLNALEDWSRSNSQQVYVVDRPLGDGKYSYSHATAIAVLAPKHRIIFIDFSEDTGAFDEYVEDFIEDLGSISDKFRYKDVIGRPRHWKENLIFCRHANACTNMEELLAAARLPSPALQRTGELLISLVIGSINDIAVVRADVPETLLDKIKRKILLFDGDQTRFVYSQPDKQEVRIQGLSGTGKTELLLHKVKERYVQDSSSRIAFTCHNKVLADSLKRRLPDFFNFMKVEQQIKWNERLWCVHAWGSQNDVNSGTYRRICHHYGLPFHRFSRHMSFDDVCVEALRQLRDIDLTDRGFAFDYIFIDESQDFPDSFFELCRTGARETVYIAGDIFQSIFDERIVTEIQPDFLLSKCYRTDPRTLMFAHGLGMGLFESPKLRWLEDEEWEACGYIVERPDEGFTHLKREPLRRFEDLDNASISSVELVKTSGSFYTNAAADIVSILTKIREDHPTVTPDDVGIILADITNEAFALADALEQIVPRQLDWTTNKAYESKRREKGSLFISNKNNVKGLEFPFVICVTERILSAPSYRNALYMMLTRSFLQTYLLTSETLNKQILPPIESGLSFIDNFGFIRATTPNEAEKKGIQTRIRYTDKSLSFYDFAEKIFDELGVLPLMRPNLLEAIRQIMGEDFDHDRVKEVAAFNYRAMVDTEQ